MKKIIVPLLLMVITFGLSNINDNSSFALASASSSEINTSYRYIISNAGETNSFKYSGSSSTINTSTFSEAVYYTFEDAGNGKYLIHSSETDRYVVRSSNDVRLFGSASIGTYDHEFEYIYEDGHAQIRVGNYYLFWTGSTFQFRTLTAQTTSQSYLSVFSLEEDASGLISAIKGIKCTDLVDGPSSSDWQSGKTAYIPLKAPTKRYLKTIESDDKASTDSIEGALAKYDFIISKYNKTEEIYEEYITDREINRSIRNNTFIEVNKNTSSVVIITVSLLSISAVLLFYMMRKKKHNEGR